MRAIMIFIKNFLQKRIDNRNRKRLKNKSPILISSNCTGGFIYHWLGLKFRSPFINLFLTPSDFLLMCENFNEFLNTPLKEIKDFTDYPVGVGYLGIKVHFMHYDSFKEALDYWNRRLERMERISIENQDEKRFYYNTEHIGFILSNWDGDESLLERFEKLPYKKIAFTDRHFSYSSTFFIKGYNRKNGNVYATQNIFGKRYIDQFDYVKFINSL